jgi:hypothetical protein
MARTKASLPIPDDWDGETWECICIAWPDSPKWHGILQGILTAPTRGRFWSEDTGSVRAAQLIGEQIWEYNKDMDPCGGGGPIIYDPETGQFWVDTNGDGIPDELFDPEPGLQETAEDIPLAGGSGMACIIAAGVVAWFEDQRDQLCDLLDASADVLEIAAAISALIGLMVPVAEAVAAFIGLAAAIAELNSTIVAEQMNQEFLDALKCIIFGNLDDSGVVTPAAFQSILEDINAEFEGLQQSIAWNMLNSIGPAGTQNCCTVYQVEFAECACAECPVFQPTENHGYVFRDENWYEEPVPLDWRLTDIKYGTPIGGDRMIFAASDFVGPCPDDENVSVYFEDIYCVGGDLDLKISNLEGESFYAMSPAQLIGSTVNLVEMQGVGQIYATIRARANRATNTPEWSGGSIERYIAGAGLSRWQRYTDGFWSEMIVPDDGSDRTLIGMFSSWWKFNVQSVPGGTLFRMEVVSAQQEGGGDCSVEWYDGSGKHVTTLLSMIGQTYLAYKVYSNSTTRILLVARFTWPE